MKTPLRDQFASRFQTVRLALLLLFVLLIAGCGKPTGPPRGGSPSATNRPTNMTAANSATNTSAPDATLQKALFEDRPNFGRDPFFPNSARRKQQTARGPGEAPKPKLPLSSYLKLTGMMRSKAGTSVWINGAMFTLGERGAAKVSFTNAQNTIEVRDVQLRCLEIHGTSVWVSVEGESGVTELRVP